MPPPRPDPQLPRKWRWLFHGFRWYVPRVVRRHFTALRLANTSALWPTDGRPVLVVLTHPAWHDPLIATVLSFAFPTDEQYAAIDAAALPKNPVFGKIGFIPVDLASLRGAAEFTRLGAFILAQPGHVLWVTPQGRFADPRERPLALRSGVGYLARSMTNGWILPVAVEYPFWNEPKPEALVRVGEPIPAGPDPDRTTKQWTEQIEAALTATADALAADAQTRDPARFTVLVDRTHTIGGRRDLRRRLVASARGRTYQPSEPLLPVLAPRTDLP